jgi:hypothetical protein
MKSGNKIKLALAIRRLWSQYHELDFLIYSLNQAGEQTFNLTLERNIIISKISLITKVLYLNH